MKSKTKLIEIPLFEHSVLVVTGTKKHLRKALKAYGAEDNAIGVPFTDDTEEVYCYLLGYLIQALNN